MKKRALNIISCTYFNSRKNKITIILHKLMCIRSLRISNFLYKILTFLSCIENVLYSYLFDNTNSDIITFIIENILNMEFN